MKQKSLLVTGLFILLILILFAMVGCQPVRYVNIHSHRNYYNKHRATTYTAPIWMPNRGVLLQQFYAPKLKQPRQPVRQRGKH